jgi:hypothetical protein
VWSLCRLPGLESSSNNKVEEDVFYDTMMLAFLRIVLSPLRDCHALESAHETEGDWIVVKSSHEHTSETIGADTPLFKNLFAWRLFTKQASKNVLLPTSQGISSTADQCT